MTLMSEGPSYLVSGGDLPFTAEDVRGELDLLDPSFDRLITAIIGSAVLQIESRNRCSLRHQVWSVSRGNDLAKFYDKLRRIGTLDRIGPAYEFRGAVYHDCSFRPNPKLFAKALKAIVNACWDDLGLSKAILRERRGEYRQPLFLEAAE